MTTAPGFTMSAVTKFGLPIAAIKISAWIVSFSISFVLEWHSVTVALAPFFFCMSRAAIGFPTILLLPIITACFPSGSIFERASISITPLGVAGTKQSWPAINLPMFIGEKPSTSLAGFIDSRTKFSSIWSGSGNCTKMPWTLEF